MISYTLLVACLSPLFSAVADYVPTPNPCPSDLVVGCYYFPGHFNPLRWTPMKEAEFPVPLLGYYRDGEPEVSDWHIKWAVEHGIDFFAFDWYCHYEQGPSVEHNKALDEGFLRARYRGQMQFCLMWCNEGKDERYTEEQMVGLAKILTERYFSQPNHLRIDGDNVLIISVPSYFVASFGVEGTARVLGKMGEVSREAGCGGLFAVSKGHDNQQMLKDAGFRALTAYNYPEAGMTDEERKTNRAPYSTMVTGMEEIWKQVVAQGVLPYIVPVSPGWDSRPWYGERALVRTNPRPRLFFDMCVAAKRYADPKLKMIIAECWNEFGEGSYVEPTAQYGFGSLDAIRDAFCEQNPQHDDLVPQAVGRQAPIFDEIPPRPETLAAADGNMLHNGGMESVWGWSTYEGENAIETGGAHGGKRCLRVPAGKGVKTQWLMPIPESRNIRIRLWYRAPEGANLRVNAALFTSQRWLGRYAEIGNLNATGDQWTLSETTLAISDTEATQFDIEFNAAGQACYVDDIEILALPPQ